MLSTPSSSPDAFIHAGLTPQESQRVVDILSQHRHQAAWDVLRNTVLTPDHPMSAHRLVADRAFAGWNEATQGPRPIWHANPQAIQQSNLHSLMTTLNVGSYDELYRWSISHGRAFWLKMLALMNVRFHNGYRPELDNIVDLSNPEEAKWLPGATLNIAECCFQAKGDAPAIISQVEGSDELITISYAQLRSRANRVASAIIKAGFKQGDRFAIDMPMHVDAVAIYLGVLLMGGTVVALADSFRGSEIDVRLHAAAPVAGIFIQSSTGGARRFPLYAEVVQSASVPRAIVLTSAGEAPPKLRAGDMIWDDFLAAGSEQFEAASCAADHPLVIIFSSSTSSPKAKEGEKPKPPKAIAWQAHTAIKSTMDAHFHHNMQPGKVLCWPTNLGWMMGSFAIFAAFANRGTLALFEGNVVSREFCRFVERAKVNMLGLVPSIAEGWEKLDATKGCDWSAIELFSSTGSPSNPSNYFYLMSRAPGYRPVFEYMGGTEIGGGYLHGSVMHPASPSCFTTPTLGTELFVPEQDSEDWRAGEVFIVLRDGPGECPPMGLSNHLLNFEHHEKYFPRELKTPEGYRLREHGDLLLMQPGGFIRSGGRADDGMNLNGIKTSSLDIENYIKTARIVGLRDVAAVAVRPPEGGEDWLVLYVVTDTPQITAQQLFAPCREAIKAYNPQLARVHDVVRIESLPLTASGKLRRRFLQDAYLESLAGK